MGNPEKSVAMAAQRATKRAARDAKAAKTREWRESRAAVKTNTNAGAQGGDAGLTNDDAKDILDNPIAEGSTALHRAALGDLTNLNIVKDGKRKNSRVHQHGQQVPRQEGVESVGDFPTQPDPNRPSVTLRRKPTPEQQQQQVYISTVVHTCPSPPPSTSGNGEGVSAAPAPALPPGRDAQPAMIGRLLSFSLLAGGTDSASWFTLH